MSCIRPTCAAILVASLSLFVLLPRAEATEPVKAKPAAHTAGTHAAATASQPALRYDPPGAGPAPGNAAYEACIDHPSPDGLVMDCQALQAHPSAKPRRKH
ncbi:MAG: hypothetical protein EKK53_05150 [Burkholderiales bacterium]|nr:MAG: hypothetical protein EKK53_05150 [Burkholderiales bacterium]